MIHHNWCEHFQGPDHAPIRHCLRCHGRERGEWYMDHDGMWLVDWKGDAPRCGERWDMGEVQDHPRVRNWRWN